MDSININISKGECDCECGYLAGSFVLVCTDINYTTLYPFKKTVIFNKAKNSVLLCL